DIPSYDITVGAFHLGCAYSFFPKGTVHLAVVDPGVGSARRPLLVVTRNYFFVGPDNGLLTLVARREGSLEAYELTEPRYWRKEMSSTFHGRDLFGPVAAHLSQGVPPKRLGRRLKEIHFSNDFKVKAISKGFIGRILFFDKFGNAMTNIH